MTEKELAQALLDHCASPRGGRMCVMLLAFAGRTQLVVALAKVPFLELFVSFSPLVTHGKNDHLREASFEVPLDRLNTDATTTRPLDLDSAIAEFGADTLSRGAT